MSPGCATFGTPTVRVSIIGGELAGITLGSVKVVEGACGRLEAVTVTCVCDDDTGLGGDEATKGIEDGGSEALALDSRAGVEEG